MASPGHLTVTLPQGTTVAGQGFASDIVPSGGYAFDLYCDSVQYESQPPYRNVVLDRGENDYQSINPDQGTAWEITKGLFSGGVGGFYAKRGQLSDNKYGMADNFDAEYLCGGPLQVNEYPGIPFGVTPVGFYRAGTWDILWTDSAAYALYRRQQGTHFWELIGGTAPYTNGASGLSNNWSSLASTAVKCVAHIGNDLMVGFGDAAKWIYTGNYTDTTLPTWAAESETGDDEYAHVALNATFQTATGTFQECIIFLGANGKLFKTTDLTIAAAAALAGGATIGDATDDAANSIAMADQNTVIYIGKNSGLYSVDTVGNVGQFARNQYAVKTTSDSGGAAPANFRDPTTLGNGYMYWLVEDYVILEREPIDGTFTAFSLKALGSQTPRMQIPLLSICAGPENALYLAAGTSTAPSLTTFKGGTQLIANTVTAGTTYIFKGFGHAHELAQNPAAWVWHGSLGSIPQLARKMWYSAEIQRLFVALHTDSTDRASSYVRVTQDNFGSFTNGNTVANGTGTPLTVTALDTIGNGDAILVGFPRRFTSLWLDMSAATFNNNAASITVSYSTGAGTWTSVGTVNDGSKGANGPFERDGVMHWLMPSPATLWATATYDGQTAYWVRLTTSALLDNFIITEMNIGYSENLRQFVVVSGNPVLKTDTGPYDAAASIKITTSTAKIETGKFSDSRPLDVKAVRTFSALTKNVQVDASTGVSLVAKIRTASDRDVSTGYRTLATYTTDALAEAGTTMDYDANNPVNFKEGCRVLLEFTPTSTLPLPYTLEAAILRFVDANPRKVKLTCKLKEVVNGPTNRHGVRASTSIKEMITNLNAWRDAVNPVAVVRDNDLGITMNMRLADFEPRLAGIEKGYDATISLVEVVG